AKGAFPEGPAVIMVHVASTNVPFTSESKDAVANVPEIENEIERAVREVGRDLKDFINKRETRRKRQEKERVIKNLLPQMAEKVAEVTGRNPPPMEGTLAQILNKVYVSRSADNGVNVLEVENNSNSKKSFKLHIFLDDEPSLNGSADGVSVVDLDGEFDVVWNVEVGKGETTVLEYEGADGSITVEGIEDELIEIEVEG
ncbi:MAG: DNA topoisomerase VI subunit B, partial [Halobacteria archaeon]|nr:DNA topoisomerase VI subunit B [Halobacteria archaeon]